VRKAVLLYNPLSGRRRRRRVADVEAVLAVVREAGVEADAAATMPADGAAGQVREAIAQGCDTILACGGDGTIHDLLQGLVGGDVALGVVPLGTANALAHDLCVPFSPVQAARAALRAERRRFAVGKIECLGLEGKRRSRYFTVAAGIGVDAHLFYELSPALKGSTGMAAYYAKAWHLWMTHRMEYFQAEYTEAGASASREAVLTELLAVRIRNFGGVLGELAPGASLDRNDLRLVLCQTASRSRYLLYVLCGLLGQSRNVGGIDLAYAEKISCRSLPPPEGSKDTRRKTYVEADGELLGTLPAEISLVPNAFSLLVPARK